MSSCPSSLSGSMRVLAGIQMSNSDPCMRNYTKYCKQEASGKQAVSESTKSTVRTLKLELFHDAGFGDVSGDWTAFDADVGTSFFTHLTGTDITIYLGNRRSRL